MVGECGLVRCGVGGGGGVGVPTVPRSRSITSTTGESCSRVGDHMKRGSVTAQKRASVAVSLGGVGANQ